MMDLVYVVQMLKDDGTVVGPPLAVFNEMDMAEYFIYTKCDYTYEFA